MAGYSLAWDINGRGDIVGTSLIPVTDQRGVTVATLWRGGAILNLNDLVDARDGWTLRDATAIDESGRILVQAHRDGAFRIGILEPLGRATRRQRESCCESPSVPLKTPTLRHPIGTRSQKARSTRVPSSCAATRSGHATHAWRDSA